MASTVIFSGLCSGHTSGNVHRRRQIQFYAGVKSKSAVMINRKSLWHLLIANMNGRTSGGKLVLLVITAKLIVSCTFRRVLWNSFGWCGLVLFHRNHVFRSFRPTRGWQIFEVNLSSVLIPNYGTWVEWQIFTCLYLRKQKKLSCFSLVFCLFYCLLFACV